MDRSYKWIDHINGSTLVSAPCAVYPQIVRYQKSRAPRNSFAIQCFEEHLIVVAEKSVRALKFTTWLILHESNNVRLILPGIVMIYIYPPAPACQGPPGCEAYVSICLSQVFLIT